MREDEYGSGYDQRLRDGLGRNLYNYRVATSVHVQGVLGKMKGSTPIAEAVQNCWMRLRQESMKRHRRKLIQASLAEEPFDDAVRDIGLNGLA